MHKNDNHFRYFFSCVFRWVFIYLYDNWLMTSGCLHMCTCQNTQEVKDEINVPMALSAFRDKNTRGQNHESFLFGQDKTVRTFSAYMYAFHSVTNRQTGVQYNKGKGRQTDIWCLTPSQKGEIYEVISVWNCWLFTHAFVSVSLSPCFVHVTRQGPCLSAHSRHRATAVLCAQGWTHHGDTRTHKLSYWHEGYTGVDIGGVVCVCACVCVCVCVCVSYSSC